MCALEPAEGPISKTSGADLGVLGVKEGVPEEVRMGEDPDEDWTESLPETSSTTAALMLQLPGMQKA